MKVFFEPIKADNTYGETIRLEDIPDNKAYARAAKAYPDDPEYVEEMLDGKGYIYINGENCRFTYQQDSL